ncbi:hypothetical protein RRG08_038624 [Elysia crispata]|uniref:Uncharacterized protein n=1 Tax=Elysia crispata TaxID=231223 RepID=A0AAE0YLR1_9GAST|nr:hypothetical protein RRG08_038624 [Elysia crispata]
MDIPDYVPTLTTSPEGLRLSHASAISEDLGGVKCPFYRVLALKQHCDVTNQGQLCRSFFQSLEDIFNFRLRIEHRHPLMIHLGSVPTSAS